MFLGSSWSARRSIVASTSPVLTSGSEAPVIGAPPDFATGLNAARPPGEVERLFAPAPAAPLTATPVSGWVNDVRHEGRPPKKVPETLSSSYRMDESPRPRRRVLPHLSKKLTANRRC